MESGNAINENTVEERDEITIYVKPILNYDQVSEFIGKQIEILEMVAKEKEEKSKKKKKQRK